MRPELAVFLKAPRLGTVKTRLAAEVGDRHALRLYRVMAARTLAASDVVLGPTVDGGYYLIGGRAPMPDVFTGMPWSTSALLDATRARLAHADITWHELRTLRDVDTAADARAEGLLT